MARIPTAFLFLLVCLFGIRTVQAQPGFILSANKLSEKHSKAELRFPWKYHAGDDSSWADPRLNETGWATVRSMLRKETQEAQEWNGIGWFRFHYTQDASLGEAPLGLEMLLHGAAEIYLDGKLIHRFGTVSTNPELEVRSQDRLVKVLPSYDPGPHVLAVRLSNTQAAQYLNTHDMIGFRLWVGPADNMIVAADWERRTGTIIPMFFVGLFLALALLHTILYINNIRETEHLYVALTSLTVMVIAILHHEQVFFLPPDLSLWTTPALASAMLMGGVGGLRLTYAIFSPRLSIVFFVVLIAGTALMLWPFLIGPSIYPALFIFGLLLYLEHVRVVFNADRRRQSGARLMSWGTVAFSIGLIYLLLLELDLVPFKNGVSFLPYIMAAILMASFSVHLASRQVRENRSLRGQLDKLRKNSRIQIENLRTMRADELKRMWVENNSAHQAHQMGDVRESHRLMLPTSVPEHPDLELAAELRPAPIGGGNNYYDFDLDGDGTLTIALGDATGDSMKTNAVVAAAKSLFSILSRNADLTRLLELMTYALHRVNFDSLGLGMTLARIKNNQLQVVSTGMPPIFIYRVDTQAVEMVDLGGAPLGDLAKAVYEPAQLILAPGDTVLMMSNGIPQRVNRAGKEMGLEQALNNFENLAPSMLTEDIINHLVRTTDGWADDYPANEDMSFIVIRTKR